MSHAGHTQESMHAARQFAQTLRDDGLLDRTWRITCEVHALRACGRQHGVERDVMLGLEGEEADDVDPAAITRRLRRIHDKRELKLLGSRRIAFDKCHHVVFLREGSLSFPSGGMRLSAFDPVGRLLLQRTYEARLT